jgi:hypothetical protein
MALPPALTDGDEELDFQRRGRTTTQGTGLSYEQALCKLLQQ